MSFENKEVPRIEKIEDEEKITLRLVEANGVFSALSYSESIDPPILTLVVTLRDSVKFESFFNSRKSTLGFSDISVFDPTSIKSISPLYGLSRALFPLNADTPVRLEISGITLANVLALKSSQINNCHSLFSSLSPSTKNTLVNALAFTVVGVLANIGLIAWKVGADITYETAFNTSVAFDATIAVFMIVSFLISLNAQSTKFCCFKEKSNDGCERRQQG